MRAKKKPQNHKNTPKNKIKIAYISFCNVPCPKSSWFYKQVLHDNTQNLGQIGWCISELWCVLCPDHSVLFLSLWVVRGPPEAKFDLWPLMCKRSTGYSPGTFQVQETFTWTNRVSSRRAFCYDCNKPTHTFLAYYHGPQAPGNRSQACGKAFCQMHWLTLFGHWQQTVRLAPPLGVEGFILSKHSVVTKDRQTGFKRAPPCFFGSLLGPTGP